MNTASPGSIATENIEGESTPLYQVSQESLQPTGKQAQTLVCSHKWLDEHAFGKCLWKLACTSSLQCPQEMIWEQVAFANWLTKNEVISDTN